MATTRWTTREDGRRLAVAALALLSVAAGCTGGGDIEANPVTTARPTTTTTETTETTAAGAAETEPVLVTPCFTVGSLDLPEQYLAADVSGNDEVCEFVLQREEQADTSVIAGELFFSSSNRTFEEFVAFLDEGLANGQEPDLLPLRLLNSGPSGRALPLLDRQELTTPNRAVIVTHESDRRTGFNAHSAVVDVPTSGDGPTQAIFLWAISTPDNDRLIVDLIESMDVAAMDVGQP